MTRSSPLKQTILFIIGSVLNLGFFCLSKYAGFPLWLDYTGSFYITSMCGPILGFISLLLHTLMLTVLVDGTAALWLFLPSAAVCGILTLYRKAMEGGRGYSVPETAMVAIISAWAMNFLSFICSPALPGRYFVYNTAFESIWNSHGKLISSLILSAGITLIELTLSMVILLLAVLISPKNHDGLSFRK